MKPNKTFKIAVTGGIGSGKSAVCQIIKEKGYPVFSCDEISKGLKNDPEYLLEIEKAFGRYGVVKEGVLDSKKLAEIVFSQKNQLKKLNAIAHPVIIRKLYKEMDKHTISFAEVPLLFESGTKDDFDGVIVVYRKEEDRILSVCRRDNLTREEVLLRIKNQENYEKIIQEGHTVIYNDGDLPSLKEKVQSAIEKIIF